MKLTIRHELVMDLGTPARALAHLLLTPMNTPQQKIESWSVEMPGIKEAATFRDGFGNKAQLVSLTKLEGPVQIVIAGVVQTTDKAGVLGRLEMDPPHALFRRPTKVAQSDPEIIAGLGLDGNRIETLHTLMTRIHGLGEATGQTQSQGGQSQSQGTEPINHADLFVGAARAIGFAARHVTGYVADGGGRFHAWAEVWEDRLGWIGFDPKVDECPADRHVRLASALDSMSSVPVRTVPVWAEMPAEKVSVSAD